MLFVPYLFELNYGNLVASAYFNQLYWLCSVVCYNLVVIALPLYFINILFILEAH